MPEIAKPNRVQVQVKDSEGSKSKSFTIYGIDAEKLFYHLLFYSEQLTKYDKVKLVCYGGAKSDEKATV